MAAIYVLERKIAALATQVDVAVKLLKSGSGVSRPKPPMDGSR